jgi:LysM repeat protein
MAGPDAAHAAHPHPHPSGGKNDIDVPGIGKVPKLAVLAGVGVVLVLVIMHYRSAGSGSGSGTGTAGTDPYPPDGTTGNPADPYSTDPATGLTYGDEGIGSGAVPAAYGLAGGSGYAGTAAAGSPYPWDGTTGNPNDPYSMDPSTGQTYGDEGYTAAGAAAGQAGPPFTNNAAWSQYAENYLITTLGMDAATVSSALGAYIAGQPVTTAQQDVINQATAIAGTPPVAGPGGYPPSIRLSQSPASNGTVTVPDVSGVLVEQAVQILNAAGLTVHGPAGVPNVLHIVTGQNPPAGSHVQKGTLVTLQYKSEAENKPASSPPPKTSQPPKLTRTYVVQRGDTLASVARKFGLSVVDLAHGNGLGTGAGLRTGQVLKV